MLYAQYLKDREGGEVFEIQNQGFATYFINNQECYIRDVYVVPELRKTGICSSMVESISKIAKTKGCNYLITTVMPTAPYSTESIKVVLACGFKLVNSNSQLVYFKKDI